MCYCMCWKVCWLRGQGGGGGGQKVLKTRFESEMWSG